MFTYVATLVKVVDGDTVDVLVDLGFSISHKVRLRLLGVDTYELHDADPLKRAKAIINKQFLVDMLSSGILTTSTSFMVKTEKTEKYGRWLAEIVLKDGRSVNALIEEHLKTQV